MKTDTDELARLRAENERLTQELRVANNELVLCRDRDRRGRTGWKLAKEASEAAQRLIDIQTKEIERLREGLNRVAMQRLRCEIEYGNGEFPNADNFAEAYDAIITEARAALEGK